MTRVRTKSTRKRMNSARVLSVWLVVMSLWLLLLSGCADTEAPSLQISGDVINHVILKEVDNDLLQIIEEAQPIYSDYDLALIAADGFMVKLDGDTIAGTSLMYDESQRWHYKSDQHPVNSRIKNIAEVVVIKKSSMPPNHQYGLNLVTQDSTVHYSIGELLSNSYESIAFIDGVSELDGISIDVMKRKKCIRLSDIITEEIEKLLVMTEDGDHFYEKVSDAYVEIATEGLHYISLDQSIYNRNIVGVMINPPSTSVMNNFYDASHYLESGEKVLTLFIDGYSYEQYEHIRDKRPELFLASLENVKKAMTVYKPVTNAGFAAMVTGKAPAVNGVLDRSFREVKGVTIFDVAQDFGYETILIEGDVNILKLKTEVELNTDQNGDGYTDDEIFANAKERIYDGYQYAMVHFHSVDESGHAYGSLSDETVDRIAEVDSYVKVLAESWEGKVIIVADHGMHDTIEAGDHGEFRHEDLLIPYSIYSN